MGEGVLSRVIKISNEFIIENGYILPSALSWPCSDWNDLEMVDFWSVNDLSKTGLYTGGLLQGAQRKSH